MKPVISLFSFALIASFALSSLGLAQNITINLEPINPPIQIPAPGGSFDYNVTVSNTGASPQTFDAWIMVQMPDSTWYGPVVSFFDLYLAVGDSLSRRWTQPVRESEPQGMYVYEGQVGIYPSTIWNSSSFTFAKTLEGSQVWEARYSWIEGNSEAATSLAVDGAGNVYVTGGSADSVTSFDFATVKYNSSGVQQWAARYDGPGNDDDFARSIAVDGDGNVYVTGRSVALVHDYATIKYNSAGVQQWVARYNGPGNHTDEAFSLTVDSVGNVYVTGESYGSGTSYDYATIKYNSAGVEQWVARYNGPGNGGDYGFCVAVDPHGNTYVTGESYNSGTSMDYATVKYNSSGRQEWVARYNGPGNDDDVAYSLAVDGAGNVYVTGWSWGNGTSNDYATIKYNSAGVQQWVARYNGPGNTYDQAYFLAVDGRGNTFVTGKGAGDYVTIKYNSVGLQQWSAQYNGPGNYSDAAYSLALDELGNVFVTGYSNGNATSIDYATIKYNWAGAQQWVACYNGPGNGNDEAYSIAVDAAGNTYVTGHSYGGGTGYDYATIKYSGGTIANWQPVEALVFGAQEPVTEYQLQPCYPNPFNATTAISYKLQAASHVSLRVYDVAGRLVSGSGTTPTTALVEGWREAGTHELTFDAGDLPSGVYFCKLQAGDYSAVQKLMLVK